ncbi:sugar phosphate isomerase/epimerase family protein [Streptosporangium sp. DT93]|uniref:sugar phosphate isomerase/epimerase family protein n=1 Tax=Streptosporangium sp. DT93 TaxID=3393428 RepID=UPI003CF08AAF
MGLLDQEGVFFTYLHMLGAPFGEPPRYTFDERIAALGHEDVIGIGFDADEFDQLLATRSADELQGVLDEHDVTIGELQILYGWHFGGDYGRMAREREDHVYDLAVRFGIPRVKTVIMTPTEMPPRDLLVERFAGICDRAAEHGLEIAFETQSVNPGFDYNDTVDMIVAAGRPNGGMVVDGWHFFRDPDAWAALEKIPVEYVMGLELRDGPAEPAVSRMDDALNRNLLPGEGDFDLVRLVNALDAKGADVRISVEVMSEELRELSAAENVRRTLAAVNVFKEAARS